MLGQPSDLGRLADSVDPVERDEEASLSFRSRFIVRGAVLK